jgi:hypothetical protein
MEPEQDRVQKVSLTRMDEGQQARLLCDAARCRVAEKRLGNLEDEADTANGAEQRTGSSSSRRRPAYTSMMFEYGSGGRPNLLSSAADDAPALRARQEKGELT